MSTNRKHKSESFINPHHGLVNMECDKEHWNAITFECQECKRQGLVHVDSEKVEGKRKTIELNVHHIKEIEDHPELALELDNLETLCLQHHNEIHGKGFKRKTNKWMHDEQW